MDLKSVRSWLAFVQNISDLRVCPESNYIHTIELKVVKYNYSFYFKIAQASMGHIRIIHDELKKCTHEFVTHCGSYSFLPPPPLPQLIIQPPPPPKKTVVFTYEFTL